MAYHEALVMVSGLPARSLSGMEAKAAFYWSVLAAEGPAAIEGNFGDRAQRHDVLAWSTLSDLARVAG